MINKKALTSFLFITFGLTLAAVFIARHFSLTMFDRPQVFSQLLISGAMFFPAIGALITNFFFVKKPIKSFFLPLASWREYVKAYILIVLLFVLNYAITWLFFCSPDFSLASFMAANDIYELPLSPLSMIAILSLVTFVFAPFLNLIPSLGEELGWRGFLLPGLEPLGEKKALMISSAIWALWHTPLIVGLGFAYGWQYWPGLLIHFILVFGLGLYFGRTWLKTRSTILLAFMHGVFNANGYGIWAIVFVPENHLLLGAVGLINALLCLFLGLYYLERRNQ
jgi:membrane protease YdiL (CAAX protease family)